MGGGVVQKAISLPVRGQVMRGMEHVPEHPGIPCPAVILYHGFTANKLQEHRMFLKLSRALESRDIASFRFDFIGSGESDGDFEDMTVTREIEEAKAILDFVRLDTRVDPARVSLLGLSMGGLVAGIVAGDRRADVNNLILVAPAGNMYELMMAGPLGDMVRAGTVWKPEQADAGGNLIGHGFVDDLARIDGFARASHFAGDVLIVHGTNDQAVPCEVARRYQEISFGGRAMLHFIEGADHTFNRYAWEQEMIMTVCDFLASRV